MRGFFRWGGKWWPGLLPLAVFWIFAAWSNAGLVESDLASQTTSALRSTILDKTKITASGRDITVAAEAFSEEGRQSALAVAEAVQGVRLVNDETRLVAEAKPFVWSIERDVVHVTLGGNAPLPAIKARLMEAARAAAGGTEVTDQMALARGAPAHFDAAAALLVDQIGKLKDGKITLSDTGVSLSGMTRELGGREAVAAALKSLPEGFTVVENAIKAPPYIFQVNKDPVAVTVTINGYVPDNTVHAALVAAVTRKFFDEKIVDNLKPSVGAPSGFAAATTLALGALSRLSTGSLVIADRDIKLSGDAFYGVAADQIRASLATESPQGWKATAEISVRPEAGLVDGTVCQQLFSELLRKGNIRFQSGRATIDPDSASLLDRLIEAALRCPAAPIEIAGHTDVAGDEAANKSLSEKRAQAVADYLSHVGLPAERFTTIGYGSSKPIAPNDTDEGKAQNRRIEFTVKE
jgi:OOP family OmpA-OmpF porin